MYDFPDLCLVFLLYILSFSARVWSIAYPNRVIFDEVHFGNFSDWYLMERFHFDIHPPLGKMIMSYITGLTSYKGGVVYDFANYYKKNDTVFISQRMNPATFSSYVGPLIYCGLRALDVTHASAFTCSLLVGTDSSTVVESRYILSDGLLHFFSALNIWSFCLLIKKQTLLTGLLTGITMGLACSCKFTALGLIALNGLIQTFWVVFTFPDILSIISRGFVMLFPCISIIYICWIIHFAYTPYKGHNSHYMRYQDIDTLMDYDQRNTTYWGLRLIDSPLCLRIYHWILKMNKINMKSKIPHPWESSPKYWPFLMDKYVLFYQNSNGRIGCFGSPTSFWYSTLSIVLLPIFILLKKTDWRAPLMAIGWSFSYFPFLLVPRTMFHYHYLIPLMFANMNLSVLLDTVTVKWRKIRGFTLTIILFTHVVCYFYFWPLIYGNECKHCHTSRHIIKYWTNGPPVHYSFPEKKFYNTTMIYGEL